MKRCLARGCSIYPACLWMEKGRQRTALAGRPGMAVWLHGRSCPPGGGGTKASVPQQHPSRCCPMQEDAHHSSAGQSQGACMTYGVFEGSLAWSEPRVPNGHS